jgi:hypothetical protein
MRVLPFKIQITKIEGNLYLGSIEDAYDGKKLSGLGVTHVLNMATEIPNFHEGHFAYKKINGRDMPTFQMHKHFDEVADFIHQAMNVGKVFVHCFCGISRSTTAILAYFIKYRGMDPRRGYEMIRKKRWIVYPNEGFMRQLLEYFKTKAVDTPEAPAKLGVREGTRVLVSKGNLSIKRTEGSKLPSIALNGPEKGAGVRGATRSLNKENQWGSTVRPGGRSVPKALKVRTEPRLNCFKY